MELTNIDWGKHIDGTLDTLTADQVNRATRVLIAARDRGVEPEPLLWQAIGVGYLVTHEVALW